MPTKQPAVNQQISLYHYCQHTRCRIAAAADLARLANALFDNSNLIAKFEETVADVAANPSTSVKCRLA